MFHVFKVVVHMIVVYWVVHHLVHLVYEKSTASIFSVIWSPKRCRQYLPPKRRNKSSTLRDVETPKINVIFKGKPVSLLTQTLINE
jgi:hypothetical protein